MKLGFIKNDERNICLCKSASHFFINWFSYSLVSGATAAALQRAHKSNIFIGFSMFM